MAYFNIDKSRLVNLEYSLYREILRTNRSGAYSSTTLTGCNTRKYHGLLVSPVEHFDGGKFVLLSSLDISVIQHDQEFNLGIHKYGGNEYSPRGHKYLTHFDLEKFPKRVYRVGGIVLSTEFLMVENRDQFLCKVSLEQAHSLTKIRLKPFLAFRNIHQLTHDNLAANTRYHDIDNGIKIKMYEGFPFLSMQLSNSSEFVATPDWYRGIEYLKEMNRGYPYKEDLFVPGYFELELKKGSSVIFSAATDESKPAGLKAKFTREQKKRIPRDTLLHNLLNSSEQFIQVRGDKQKLLAGYHWYDERLRDTLIALPGLMSYQENRDIYIKILDQAVKDVRTKYLGENDAGLRYNLKDADVPLWLFHTLQQLEDIVPDIDLCSRYRDVMVEIIEVILRRSSGLLRVGDNGLIYTKKEGCSLTWMDAVVDGAPVTQRPGYVVEINALWYNALCYYFEKCVTKERNESYENISILISKVKNSFVDLFWNSEGGYLYDYVDGDDKGSCIRPNQVIATSLSYSPLSSLQKKMVLDVVERELLTPKGLRTLSPSSPQYKGVVEGDQRERDLALHQGTVYPWLLPFFVKGYLSINKKAGLSLVHSLIDGFDKEMGEHCISTISECFDGNPPHNAKGAVSMAWSVSAVMQIIKLTEKYI
ncbi:amylo-alpha-1,6-glucosidase [Marinilabiliaceae bacterium ANBcel2]|nr:amylo-alpha-1,6-glucosidase [Marinilabiliaceae bacterium ANBcel2]